MNTILAQELKRRGIAAVDDLIASGDVHVIRNNRPEYVILSEERYKELVAEAEEAYGGFWGHSIISLSIEKHALLKSNS